jgi:hypothetical protein
MKCQICQRDGLNEKELKVHLKYFHKQVDEVVFKASNICPECGSTMWFEEGCATCHTCGFSKCA